MINNTEKISHRLKAVNDKELNQCFENLIEENQSKLKGEYIGYTLYEKENGDVYSLIYADYDESKDINIGNVEDISLQDTKFMHKKLKESGLAVDYLFVVTYYNYKDRLKGSIGFNDGSVITKDF